MSPPPDRATLLRLIAFLDLTALDATDTPETVARLCAKARQPLADHPGVHCAAVCVWPNFAGEAASRLHRSGLDIACVAAAFPSGQSPLAAKRLEIEHAVAAGATEIDIPFPRGRFLAGDHGNLLAELVAMKNSCGNAHLKVILETCDLPDEASIRAACGFALRAGADFLKTSTGKGRHGATLEHTRILLEEARAWREASGKVIGVKPAGGIRTAEQAMEYLELAAPFFDELTPAVFRIGASSLLDDLLAKAGA